VHLPLFKLDYGVTKVAPDVDHSILHHMRLMLVVAFTRLVKLPEKGWFSQNRP
jgi:hypothetical protein